MAPIEDFEARFEPVFAKMQAAGQSESSVANFKQAYRKLLEGDFGMIPESAIVPADGLRPLSELECHDMVDMGRDMLGHTLHILLNGGLGTSMGLTGPKALVRAKSGKTFLDLQLERAEKSGIRLLFMHSAATRQACMEVIEPRLTPPDGLPLDFVQHMVPRLDGSTLQPISWPKAPEREWCPPGHGNLYAALFENDLLRRFLDAGYRYAFISNIDNLAAWPDPRILGYMYVHSTGFLMETARRAEADRKGGHLAHRPDGSLILRERAQCPPEDIPSFEDVSKHRFFNTNNLWVDLERLYGMLEQSGGVTELPLIVNEKTVDAKDATSPRVLQLESAAGAAVSWFEDAEAIEVPRTRFAPVKTTDDLLTLRSDAVLVTDEGHCIPADGRKAPPTVILDPRFHRTVQGLDQAFPQGPPSLKQCRRLELSGDVRFGAGVTVKGDVKLEANPGETLRIPDGAVLGSD